MATHTRVAPMRASLRGSSASQASAQRARLPNEYRPSLSVGGGSTMPLPSPTERTVPPPRAAKAITHDEHSKIMGAVWDKVTEKFARKWDGSFRDPQKERLFSQYSWARSRLARKITVIAWALVGFLHTVTVIANFANGERVYIIPSLLSVTIGTVLLTLGLGRSEFAFFCWYRLSCLGVVCVTLPALIMYPLILCEKMPDEFVARMVQCSALASNHVPWATLFLGLVVSVMSSGSMGLRWYQGLGMSILCMSIAVGAVLKHVDIDRVARALLAYIAGLIIITFSIRLREQADRRFWAAIHATMSAQVKGRDAERRKVQAIVERERAEAQAAAFQNVMRYVCHELRNPLHGILGLLEGVAIEVADLPISADVGYIERSASQMATILNDVLDLGQLQRGQMQLSVGPTNVPQLVERCVAPMLGIATVPVRIHTSSTVVQPVTVDGLRIGQIVTNAVSNAVKNTKAGAVDMFVRVEHTVLCFDVFDTGHGLSAGAGNLFEPYAQDTSQARSTHNRFDRGTGLGLAIAKNLVTLMKGEIGLTNRVDGVRGAHFWFRVPLAGELREVSALSPTMVDLSDFTRTVCRVRHRAASDDEDDNGEEEEDSGGVVENPPFPPAFLGGFHAALTRSQSESPSVRARREAGVGVGSAYQHADSDGSVGGSGPPPAALRVFRDHARESGGMVAFASPPVRLNDELSKRHITRDSDGSSDARQDPFWSRRGEALLASDGESYGRGSARGHVEVVVQSATGAELAPASEQVSGQNSSGGHSSARSNPNPNAHQITVEVVPSRRLSFANDHDSSGISSPSSSVEPRSTRSSRSGLHRQRRRRRPPPHPSLPPMHVLLVDDEKINRVVLTRHCRRAGCTVVCLNDGEELLAMLARGETTADGKYLIDVKDPQCKQFDAIFLDIVMERSSGEEVCGRLRAAGIKCAIIAATGNGLRDDLKRYQDSGFSGVLLKPFASKAVVSSLSDLVVKKKSEFAAP